MKTTRVVGGFTLVELLVVSALFLLFFSLVVTAARPSPVSQVRQFTQDLSSAILAAQTRAMTAESGAGLMLDPAGTLVFASLSLPPIVGTASGVSATATSVTATFTPTNADSSDLSTCFAVRLLSGGASGAPITPWMTFAPPNTATFNTSMNQTMNNTVLPAASSLGFIAARYPARGDVVSTAPRFAAIDLRYSGVGMVTTDPFGTLTGSGTVSLRFDRTGYLDMLTRTSGTPPALVPPAPLYLLVASTTDISANTSLRSPTSRWIAIAPETGRVTVAMNVGGNYSTTPTQADINNARSNVRQAITQGVR